VLTQGKAELKIASTQLGSAQLLQPGQGKALPIHTTLAAADLNDCDAVVLMGGDMQEFLQNPNTVKEFMKKAVDSPKPVGAICRGIMLLTSPGVLTKKVSIAKSDQLREKWTENRFSWVDKPVVVDGKFITAKDPEAGEEFARTPLEALRQNR
jgi:deglycase